MSFVDLNNDICDIIWGYWSPSKEIKHRKDIVEAMFNFDMHIEGCTFTLKNSQYAFTKLRSLLDLCEISYKREWERLWLNLDIKYS